MTAPTRVHGLIAKDELIDFVHTKVIDGGDVSFVQGCSYDLRVGTIFTKTGRLKRQSGVGPEPVVVIQPGEFVSVYTLEELRLPNDVAATAFAINSQSSRGLLVLNPGHIDPGYQGPLTVTAVNLTTNPLPIEGGSPIFTVVFQRLPKDTHPYSRNRPRDELERRFLEFVAGGASKNVGDLIEYNKESAVVTAADLDEKLAVLKAHRWNYLTGILSAVAIILSVVGLIIAVRDLGGPSSSQERPQPAAPASERTTGELTGEIDQQVPNPTDNRGRKRENFADQANGSRHQQQRGRRHAFLQTEPLFVRLATAILVLVAILTFHHSST